MKDMDYKPKYYNNTTEVSLTNLYITVSLVLSGKDSHETNT